jgi:hypothetical protein
LTLFTIPSATKAKPRSEVSFPFAVVVWGAGRYCEPYSTSTQL